MAEKINMRCDCGETIKIDKPDDMPKDAIALGQTFSDSCADTIVDEYDDYIRYWIYED
jgi:hypothetical protein